LPSIFTALPEQLGLKLEAQRAPIDVLVVYEADLPTSNDAPVPSARPQASNPEPSFEVASIRRNTGSTPGQTIRLLSNRFIGTNVTVRDLIATAYAIQTSDQLSGEPGWITGERYDVQAVSRGEATFPQQRVMLQTLLADRFQLVLRRETRTAPIYSLIRGQVPRLKPAAECPPEMADCSGFNTRPGEILGRRVTMARLAAILSGPRSGRRVVDNTGLDGTFDVELRWTPDPGQLPPGPGPDDVPRIDPNGPSLFTAVEEQLGLKLEPSSGSMEHFVIDRVERPREN
jgi:uncharacterized protein (TIGR03435 family)